MRKEIPDVDLRVTGGVPLVPISESVNKIEPPKPKPESNAPGFLEIYEYVVGAFFMMLLGAIAVVLVGVFGIVIGGMAIVFFIGRVAARSERDK